MPGGFHPFLLNPGWLDAAYLSTYGWSEYFRSRNVSLPQQNNNMHVPQMMKTSPQLPPNLHAASDFYVHHPNGTNPGAGGTFHPPFLPATNILPPFNSDGFPQNNMHHQQQPRSVPPMEQLSLRLSPVSNTQSLSPPQPNPTPTHDSRINSSTSDVEHDNNDEEEDEIDVVKSAFHPIKAASLLLQEIQHPDSTVKEEPVRKCDLKAPVSRKISTIVPQKSPATKIHTTKNVWRPY